MILWAWTLASTIDLPVVCRSEKISGKRKQNDNSGIFFFTAIVTGPFPRS